LGAI
jgi:hypothetical protein